MKKLLYPIAIMLLFAVPFTFTSCEPENIDPPIKQQLVGKWTFEAAISNSIDYGVSSKDTTWFTVDDYFDFKADGTVDIMTSGVAHNGNWTVTGDRLFFSNTGYVDFNGGFELPLLTQSDLKLFQTQDTPPDHYFEGTLVFKR